MLKSIRRGFGKRTALLGALTALIVVGGASAASAAIVLTPEEKYAPVQKITVSGTPTNGAATHVAIAACNVDTGLEVGAHCDGPNAVKGLKSLAQLAEGVEITVRKGPWTDWSFTSGTPQEQETETTCLSTEEPGPEEDQCAIVVSHYEKVGMGFVPLNTEDIVEIHFK